MPGRLVSDGEIREVLISGDDHVRSAVLSFLGDWAGEPNSRWDGLVVPFLETVWPKQRIIRTAAMAAMLLRLAFRLPRQFPEIAKAILPRLVPVGGSLFPMTYEILEHEIAAKYPVALLELLDVCLPTSPSDWPLQFSKVINAIRESPAGAVDGRLADLMRRSELNF
jgi:hypothetical protein